MLLSELPPLTFDWSTSNLASVTARVAPISSSGWSSRVIPAGLQKVVVALLAFAVNPDSAGPRSAYAAKVDSKPVSSHTPRRPKTGDANR